MVCDRIGNRGRLQRLYEGLVTDVCARLTEESDILKKANAYFANDAE
jgi:transposase-like protein